MSSVFKRGGRKAKGAYLASYVGADGKWLTRSTRTVDRDAAQRIANKWEADAALRRGGVIDQKLEQLGQQAKRTLEEHLDDYEAKLQAAGRSADYVTRTRVFILDIGTAAGFEAVGDISADKVNHYAAELLKKRAARSVAARLTAIKGFTRWLAMEGKLPSDPLASVRKPSAKNDRRMVRRMLLSDEWQWLRPITLGDNAERQGMRAGERVLLYALAIQTGLRASELRSLSRGSLFLDDPQPYVTCKAGSTKNRQDARQYIKPELADELRRHVATKAPGAPVFAMPRREDVAAMLRADLAAARREWLETVKHDPEEYQRREKSDFLLAVNHEKEVLDFHSLRHTCGAWLAKSGAHPKTIQTIMRHSVITLTMDPYGHLFPGQEAETVAGLPDMLPPLRAFQATGTDDEAAGHEAARAVNAQCAEGRKRLRRAKGGELAPNTADEDRDKRASPNPLPVPTLGEHWQEAAKPDISGRGGDRTRTEITLHGILSPERLPIPPLGQEHDSTSCCRCLMPQCG